MMFPEMRPRLPLAGAAIAACIGVVAADFTQVPWQLWVAGCVAACGLVIWRRTALLCAIAIALAFASTHVLRQHGSPGRLLSTRLIQPQAVRATGIVLTEPDKPKGGARNSTARFRMRLETAEIGGAVYDTDAVVQVRWAGEVPVYGDRVEMQGSASNLAPSRNPGQFDFRRYAQRQGVYSEISARHASDCRIIGHGFGNPAQAAAFASRHWISERLALDLTDDPAIASLIASMVLGMRGETPEELQELFRTTGTLHLFAVSGLNIAMLAAISWYLLKPLRVSRRVSIFLTIPLLIFYAMITGLSASCVRATIMGSLLLAGFLFDRPPSVFNSLGAAALLVLGWDTNQLFTPGAQFSFSLVVAIALAAKPLEKKIEPFGRPDDLVPRAIWNLTQRMVHYGWRTFAATLGVTLAAWFGSLSFTAVYFHLFSLSAIVANLVAVPLAFAILILGLISTIAASVSTTLSVLFNNANWLCAKLLVLCVQLCADLPHGHTYVPALKLAQPVAEYTVFDLQDGGAIHLRSEGEDWLVDCGHKFEYERMVLPFLRSRGVNRLDGLVLTHGDARHIGAAQDAWSELRPTAVFDLALKDRSQTRRSLHAAMARSGYGKRLVARGDRVELNDGFSMEVLFPPRGLLRGVADDKAMVLRLTSRGFRTLFMSDAGFSTEQWLIENEPDLQADVLVKGWHAKDTSSPGNLLARVQPRALILGNPGFGGKETLVDEFAAHAIARGAAVFRQDDVGAVQVEIGQDGIMRIRGFLAGAEVALQPTR